MTPTDRERWPKGGGFAAAPPRPLPGMVGSFSWWTSGDVLVISSLIEAEYPDGDGTGPQWHLSVSSGGARPKKHEVRRTLRAFGMVGAEEDNHHPGVARHFWIPVDPAHRVACQCKSDETVIVEPDGYKYSQEIGACAGCELQRLTGQTCKTHPSG